jgi:cysteine-rich repeat protein
MLPAMRRVLLLVVLFGCGDNRHAVVEPPAECGNGVVETGEDCDDNDTIADVVCDATCHFTCGNGALDADLGEICDFGITSGPGSCPTTCDDGQVCTTDVLSGSACTTECVHSAISGPVDGDGCCPAGANANTDSDCTAMCGNGILETGEVCDTGITAGAGACPLSCDDSQSCTTDTLMNPDSCQAACAHTDITQPMNSDGCCPPGATSLTDNDCLASCGNGVVDAGETCDTAIASGAGKCPTTCSDGDVCTSDVLSNPATCTAHCVFVPITMAINNDGCCPMGANANNDNDCMPMCGNGVKEGAEQCDDGNMNNTDTCTNACRFAPAAYRFSDLDVRDPHIFVNFIGCRDVTDVQLAGFSVNSALQTSIQTDGSNPPDGHLDFSPTVVFRPLDQTAGATTELDFYFASCTSPLATTTCTPDTTPPTVITATSQATGTCLAALAGTTHPYNPPITSATGPCYLSSPTSVTLNLSGIPITLHDARLAATYVGSPATSTVNGLLTGFITEVDANATIIPASFPLVGGQPLSSLLPGGTGNCAGYSDKDTNNGQPGWWFYLNFTAPKVPWSEP